MTTRSTDQMHRSVTVPEHPHRIISLVPSQTELLYDLGLGESVVGITKFCVHPEIGSRTNHAWAAPRRWTSRRCVP
jgi:ABC-type Fe3+-hydroxamate transport system substrate-binding protein